MNGREKLFLQKTDESFEIESRVLKEEEGKRCMWEFFLLIGVSHYLLAIKNLILEN